MKKLITFLVCSLLIISVCDYKFLDNYIYTYIKKGYFDSDYNIVINTDALKPNKYVYKEYSSFAKNTNNFYPKNKNDLLNIYYTILNNGYENFSYYCDFEYKDCLKDVQDLSKDSDTFTYLNQLVHPFNSFKTIQSNYNSNGRIDVEVIKKYTDEDIEKINNKLNNIINELNVNNYTNLNDKIKVFHDYLANTNKYDKNKEIGNSNYNSDGAIGTLFEGYSVCSGYSDTLALYLDMLDLDNVKVATEKHVWNAVKINNNWYHIDLTWDDPMTSTNEDIIRYDYFLITSSQLLTNDTIEHNFSTTIYDFIK